MPTNKNVHRLNRYAAVKLRQRLAQTSKKSAKALYNDFLFRGWIPESGNGELLSESGFKRQLTIVRRDMNHSFSSYSISFLYRGITTAYRNLYGRSKAHRVYNGMREMARMTGLQETTLRDILILTGELR